MNRKIKKLSNAQTRLEKKVQAIINEDAADYDDGIAGYMRDLNYGGCSSGMVGDLIYYSDTLKFYKTYRQEINQLLTEDLADMGAKSPGEMLRDWDDADPLAMDTQNQNLLAWYAFERTAQLLADRAGIDA